MDNRCSDIRDTCVLGAALRRGRDPVVALSEALDATLYRGVRPSVKPLTRAEAIASLLALHCPAHLLEAEALIATLSPGTGFITGRAADERTAGG
jgi:hypothetical protein